MTVLVSTLTQDQAMARIAQLEAANAALKQAAQRKLAFKVTSRNPETGKGTDGAVSMYGLGQFPVTLYASQWERLFDAIPALKQFLIDNAALLARKA